MPVDENELPETPPSSSDNEHRRRYRGQNPSSTPHPRPGQELGLPLHAANAHDALRLHPSAMPVDKNEVLVTAPTSLNVSLSSHHARVPLSTIPLPNRPGIMPAYTVPIADSERYTKKDQQKQQALMSYALQEIRRYCPGEKLTLYPREPGIPHGLPEFDSLSEKPLPDGQVLNFDPTMEVAPEELAQVKVLDVIKGGIGFGAQLLLCEVLKAPTHTQAEGEPSSYKSFDAGLKVVLKIFDPIFFPKPDDRDWIQRNISNNDRASGQLSREACALRRLYLKKLTGHPHLAPQYHGSWAMKFNLGDSPEIRWRCAGAVLMEYIEGASIESMCDRDEDGNLDPESAFLSYPGSQDGKSGLSFSDLSARLKVFRKLLDGCVSFLHTGSNHRSFDARDVFITLGNNGVALEEPRVVILDYSFCVAWSDTKDSKKGRADEVYSGYPKVPSRFLLDLHPNERLPRPPHPAWKYNVNNLSQFAGWYPPEWLDCEDGFKNWLEEEFGKLVDGEYSTYETLEEVMKLASKAAKRRYFAEYPGKTDADLEKGDPALLQYPEREEQRLRDEAWKKENREAFLATKRRFEKLREDGRLREEAEDKQTMDKSLTAQRHFGQLEEKENSQVNQPKGGDKKSGTWGKFRLPFRPGKDKGDKQAKDGGHGGDAEGGASASVDGGSARTSTKRQVDGSGKGSLRIPKKRAGNKPKDGGHAGDESGGESAKPPITRRFSMALDMILTGTTPPQQK